MPWPSPNTSGGGSEQTHGPGSWSRLQWHVHLHILTTDGAFSDDGSFHPLATWDGKALMRLFRERLLARLIEKHAISQELDTELLAWRHPGFSAHVGEPISADDTQAIENPDRGKHRTLFYSYYANRVRGDRAAEEPAKVHTDPLTCRKCGGKLKIVAYLHDAVGASVSTPSA